MSTDVRAVPGPYGPIVTRFVTHPRPVFVWHPVDLGTPRPRGGPERPSTQPRPSSSSSAPGTAFGSPPGGRRDATPRPSMRHARRATTRGGYVVGPGSWSGRSRYRIVHGPDPVPAPAWILAALQPPIPRCPPRQEAPHSAYIRAAIDGEMRRVAEAAPGRRNATLFQAAARLGRFVHAGQLNDIDVDAALNAAASGHVGVERFSSDEIRRTIRSGLARSGRDAGHRRGEGPVPGGGHGPS